MKPILVSLLVAVSLHPQSIIIGKKKAGGGGGSFTIVASAGKSGNGTGVTSDPLDITGATSVYVAVAAYGKKVSDNCTVTDNNSHTYTAVPQVNIGSAVPSGVGIFYYKGLTGASGYTFTADCGSDDYPSLAVIAVSGAVTTGTESQKNFDAIGAGTTIQAGSITTTQAEIVVAAASHLTQAYTISIDGTYTIPSGANVAGAGGTSMPVAFAYKIQSASGAENPTWTISSSDTNSAAMIASFQ
jgi:hypothetical protein